MLAHLHPFRKSSRFRAVLNSLPPSSGRGTERSNSSRRRSRTRRGGAGWEGGKVTEYVYVCMQAEVLITRASSSPVAAACPLLLYERIIIGRSARANAHAEFLSSRWAPLSAFRAVTRAEDDRPGWQEVKRHTWDARWCTAGSAGRLYADCRERTIANINDIGTDVPGRWQHHLVIIYTLKHICTASLSSSFYVCCAQKIL